MTRAGGRPSESPEARDWRERVEANRRVPRYCQCGTRLATDNRERGICDRCRNKEKVQGVGRIEGEEEPHEKNYSYLPGLVPAMQRRVISARGLAALSGVPAQSVWHYARLFARAPEERTRKLARVLGVSAEELKGEE